LPSDKAWSHCKIAWNTRNE